MVDAFAFRPFVDCFYACYSGLALSAEQNDACCCWKFWEPDARAAHELEYRGGLVSAERDRRG